jgi:hypothetical protein
MAPTEHRDPFDDLRSYASGLVDDAPPLDSSSLRLLEGAPIPRRPHRLTVPAMAAIGMAAMLLIAEVGVSIAANSAVPGDSIYGVDLLVEDALVAIGIPIDKAAERIDEAEVLLARSELREAIKTARVAYKDMGDDYAAATVVHLVDAEMALAAGVDPATEDSVRTTFGALLQTTKSTSGAGADDVRAINSAAWRVASAARADEVPEP